MWLHICDPASTNEVLEGSIKIEKKSSIAINTIFNTFWGKNDYSVIFLSKVTKCWTLPCMISFKAILQRLGLSKIIIHVYCYGPIKKQMCHNTSFLTHFQWKKCLCWLAYSKYGGNKQREHTSSLVIYCQLRLSSIVLSNVKYSLSFCSHHTLNRLIVFGAMNIWEKFWPWLIFLPITQNQFYLKEPHLVMLGHITMWFQHHFVCD